MRNPDPDYQRGYWDAIYGEPRKNGETVMYFYGYENGKIDLANENTGFSVNYPEFIQGVAQVRPTSDIYAQVPSSDCLRKIAEDIKAQK